MEVPLIYQSRNESRFGVDTFVLRYLAQDIKGMLREARTTLSLRVYAATKEVSEQTRRCAKILEEGSNLIYWNATAS
ncbi:hypothetical protein Tco_1106398 [Tanacetum coccineum]